MSDEDKVIRRLLEAEPGDWGGLHSEAFTSPKAADTFYGVTDRIPLKQVLGIGWTLIRKGLLVYEDAGLLDDFAVTVEENRIVFGKQNRLAWSPEFGFVPVLDGACDAFVEACRDLWPADRAEMPTARARRDVKAKKQKRPRWSRRN